MRRVSLRLPSRRGSYRISLSLSMTTTIITRKRRNHESLTFVVGIRIRLSHRKDETLPILESSKLEAKSLKGVFVSRSKAVLPPSLSLFPRRNIRGLRWRSFRGLVSERETEEASVKQRSEKRRPFAVWRRKVCARRESRRRRKMGICVIFRLSCLQSIR